MKTSQKKFNSKRRCNDDNVDEPNHDQQPAKLQRLESSSGTKPETKINDLNDDCLKKIFGYLDLVSLFSVAVANEYLRPAAGEVYKQKCGAINVAMGDCNDLYPNTRANARNEWRPTAITQYNMSIKIRGLKTCLQFLRCFGSSIDHLLIDFENSRSKRYQYLLQQMNDFCAETLVRLSLYRTENVDITQRLQNVFANVKKIEFDGGIFGHQWPSIRECFPNVENLQFDHVQMITRKMGAKLLRKPFEHLNHICIKCSSKQDNSILSNLIQMAPQLNYLSISANDNFEIPIKFLLEWIKPCPLISKLIVYGGSSHGYTEINSEAVQQLIIEHPSLTDLRLNFYVFTVDDAMAVVRGLNSLKWFSFRMLHYDYTNFNQKLSAEWIVNNRQVWGGQYEYVGLKRKTKFVQQNFFSKNAV